MDNLLKILSNVLKEKDKFKNLTDLYNLCVSKGYVGDIAKFESEYTKLVEQCSNMLKTSEISDLDLESIAGGVNINVSLKSSIAMIMSALSLSGSASSIASAANPKFESNNSSIYNKVRDNLPEPKTLAIGLTSAALGAIGSAALSVPITFGITKYELISDALNNVIKLVYSLNAEDSESVSFNKLTGNEKKKLIESAYSELDIKLNKTIDISKESVRTTLLSKLNEKIANLNKNINNLNKYSKSKKVQLMKLLKMCLETKSNAGIISQSNGQQSQAGSMASPSNGGSQVTPKKELSDEDRAAIEAYKKRLQDYEKNVNTHLETAQKNRDQFKNGDAMDDCAAKLLATFMKSKENFDNIVARAKKLAEAGDMEGLQKTCNEAKKVMDSLPKSAAAILDGAQRAGMTSGLYEGIARMRNIIDNKANK